MTLNDLAKESLFQAEKVTNDYLSDLSDAELLVRAIPGTNHIAWQWGHLIKSERGIIEMVVPGSMPALPAGFAEKHSNDTAGLDDPAAFCTKAEYSKLAKEQRQAALAALAKLSDEELNKPAPERFKTIARQQAGMFVFLSTHWLMHAGQWAIIRRKLGRKPLF